MACNHNRLSVIVVVSNSELFPVVGRHKPLYCSAAACQLIRMLARLRGLQAQQVRSLQPGIAGRTIHLNATPSYHRMLL